VHLSHRCFALAAWNDFRLRRRQPCCKEINPSPPDANMQFCREAPPGQSNSFIMLAKQIPEEPENKFLFFQGTYEEAL
jgi:hypothetical protein